MVPPPAVVARGSPRCWYFGAARGQEEAVLVRRVRGSGGDQFAATRKVSLRCHARPWLRSLALSVCSTARAAGWRAGTLWGGLLATVKTRTSHCFAGTPHGNTITDLPAIAFIRLPFLARLLNLSTHARLIPSCLPGLPAWRGAIPQTLTSHRCELLVMVAVRPMHLGGSCARALPQLATHEQSALEPAGCIQCRARSSVTRPALPTRHASTLRAAGALYLRNRWSQQQASTHEEAKQMCKPAWESGFARQPVDNMQLSPREEAQAFP
jgi:hypothetical protein